MNRVWASLKGPQVSIQPANRTKDHSSVLVSSGYGDHWSLFICVLNHLFPLDLAWSGLTVLRFLPLTTQRHGSSRRGALLPCSILHMGGGGRRRSLRRSWLPARSWGEWPRQMTTGWEKRNPIWRKFKALMHQTWFGKSRDAAEEN